MGSQLENTQVVVDEHAGGDNGDHDTFKHVKFNVLCSVFSGRQEKELNITLYKFNQMVGKGGKF